MTTTVVSHELAVVLAFDAFLEAAPMQTSLGAPFSVLVEEFITEGGWRFDNPHRVLWQLVDPHMRRGLLEQVFALDPPVPHVEALVAALIGRVSQRAQPGESALACVRANRWRFLATLLDSSRLDVNYNHGELARLAIQVGALDCLRVLLEHNADVTSSYRRVECIFYEHAVCESTSMPCRHRVVTTVCHTVPKALVVEGEAKRMVRRIQRVLGDVHHHDVDESIIMSPKFYAQVQKNLAAYNLIQSMNAST